MRYKKSLGQHLLTDIEYLDKIGAACKRLDQFPLVMEIGPGRGAMTNYLYPLLAERLIVVELDDRFAKELEQKFDGLRIIHRDFLEIGLDDYIKAPSAIAGNFPYNISTEIIFKVLENRDLIHGMLGMFQKEVGMRLCAEPGSKAYGIPSVMAGLFFDREFLFDIPPTAFTPPPKVDSAMVWMQRKEEKDPGQPYSDILKVVKAAFNQRRKTLRNSLKGISAGKDFPYADKRPEQLEPQSFVGISKSIYS